MTTTLHLSIVQGESFGTGGADGERESFAIESLPKLTNRGNKLCSLNASLLVILRAYPDIISMIEHRRRQEDMGETPFLDELGAVLSTRMDTNLLGLRRVLRSYYPQEPAYAEESTVEGCAPEAMQRLVEVIRQECGGDRRFCHKRRVTEDKGQPPLCPTCHGPLQEFSEITERDFTCAGATHVVGAHQVHLQQIMDDHEELERKKRVLTACLSCEQQHEVEGISEVIEAPEKLFIEASGAIMDLRGIAEDISWGGKSFEATGLLHHHQDHFYASIKVGKEWFMFEDYCDNEDLWKRKYFERGGSMETASDGTSTIHRLHEKVLLVLLERKRAPEEEEYEVCMVFSSNVWHASK